MFHKAHLQTHHIIENGLRSFTIETEIRIKPNQKFWKQYEIFCIAGDVNLFNKSRNKKTE